eukprot:1324893-Amorphochlora_amoeboformis.AAC.1
MERVILFSSDPKAVKFALGVAPIHPVPTRTKRHLITDSFATRNFSGFSARRFRSQLSGGASTGGAVEGDVQDVSNVSH